MNYKGVDVWGESRQVNYLVHRRCRYQTPIDDIPRRSSHMRHK
jgi:hypothetical protein